MSVRARLTVRQGQGGDVGAVTGRMRLASMDAASGRVTPTRRAGNVHTGTAGTVHAAGAAWMPA